MPFEIMPPPHPKAAADKLSCGSCQWFASGFETGGCASKRGVSSGTLACVEFQKPFDDPFSVIETDKFIGDIRKKLQGSQFILDASLVDELKAYAVQDSLLQNGLGTMQDIEGISKTLRNVIALRSRVSAIYTNLIDIKYEFEAIESAAYSWVYSKYSTLRALKNEMQRKAIFDKALPEIAKIQKHLKKMVDIAKYVDDKLNSNEFTLRAILASSERLWLSKESIKSVVR